MIDHISDFCQHRLRMDWGFYTHYSVNQDHQFSAGLIIVSVDNCIVSISHFLELEARAKVEKIFLLDVLLLHKVKNVLTW